MISCLKIVNKILATTGLLSLVFILGIGTTGLHPIEAVASSHNGFADGADYKKAGMVALSDLKPDLIVQNIALSPANPSIGDTVTITVTVKNQGNEEASSSRVAYYIDDIYISAEYIDPLDAGTTTVATFTWEAQVGSHIIKAVADSTKHITEADESNNTKTFTFATTAPDLIIQSISWTPENPSRGDTIVFTISIKNQGTNKSRSTNVNFYIDGSSRGRQDVYSIDAGATVTRTYTWVATTGQHAITATVDESNNIQESDETNNEQSVTFSTLPPDLIIQNISWSPQNPSRNDKVTLTATVKNQGSGRSDTCHIAYFIDEIHLASELVSPLEAGTSTDMSCNFSALADSYEITVIIDYYEKVTESDEDNNESKVTFLTLLPDLFVRNISWSPTDAAVGDNVTFTVIIRNQGTGKAENSRAALYVSGSCISNLEIPEIDAGTEVTKSFKWESVAGEHTVNVYVDNNGEVTESNEANNKGTSSIFILPPDLIVQGINWSPEKPLKGETVTFTVTIANQGSGIAENFRVAYYIDDAFLTSDYVSKIESGATGNKTFTWEAQNGLHTFKAVADCSLLVPENDEDNNENTVVVSTMVPDLVINNISWSPASFSAGDEVTLDVSIMNQGSNTAGSFRITYYIDGSAAGYQDVGQMEAGSVVTESFPWTAEVGSHTVKMTADSNNQVVESDETNNVRTVNLPPPDLILQDITWSPKEASVGDTVIFTVNIKNQGNGKTDSSQAAFYIDGSAAGYQDVPAMDSGAMVTKTFTWVAEAGSHVVKVAADSNNQVTEVDETNNENTINFSTLTPDLIIQDISWFMENQLISDDATFTITIKNQGSAKADGSRITCYIDGSPSDYHDIQGISTGAAVTETFLLTVKEGPHTLKVVADSENQVMEIDETNNEKTLDFSTIAPDLVIQNISWWPTEALVGDTITFTVRIKNQGSYKATNPRVDFYIDSSPLSYYELDEIDVGATVVKDFTWVAEAGSHDVSTFVDLDGMIHESNESNNTESQPFSLPAPANVAQKPMPASSPDNSMLGNWWWLLFVALVMVGSITIIVAIKANKK